MEQGTSFFDGTDRFESENHQQFAHAVEVVGGATDGDLDLPSHFRFFIDHRPFVGHERLAVATSKAKRLVRLPEIARGMSKIKIILMDDAALRSAVGQQLE